MLYFLACLLSKHQESTGVSFEYDCLLCWGTMGALPEGAGVNQRTLEFNKLQVMLRERDRHRLKERELSELQLFYTMHDFTEQQCVYS